MLRDCPCSTKTREVLGNPSPLPSRFPSTLEISLGLRPREISRVSGNLSGVGDGFPNTSLVLVEHGYIPAHCHPPLLPTKATWLDDRESWKRICPPQSSSLKKGDSGQMCVGSQIRVFRIFKAHIRVKYDAVCKKQVPMRGKLTTPNMSLLVRFTCAF